MALQVVATKSGTGIQYDLGTLDSALVLPGVVVTSSNTFAIAGSGSDQRVQIMGLVGGYNGVLLGAVSDSVNKSISIGATGIVSTLFDAITLRGSGSALVNYGEITAADGNGVFLNVTDTTTPLGRLINYGTIHGDNNGILVNRGGDYRITNYGTISAQQNLAVYTDVGNDLLINRGRIEGKVDLFSGNDTLINRGLLSDKVATGQGNDLVDNRSGTIDGQITLEDGNDTFIPGAGIEDAVGGDGTDLLDFTKSQGIRLALDGSIDALGWAKDDSYSGFENITGSATGNDTLIGDSSDNVLTGLGGNDSLTGLSGTDTLLGGRGADKLAGGDGADTLDGGDGNDSLAGGGDADTLTGGIGNDSLTGGAGIDILVGGSGADKFVFALADVAGSTTADGNHDEIQDFARTEKDRIDLSAIDANANLAKDQAFTFIGTAAFHNAPGELRIEAQVGGYFVLGDTNGDGTADFAIAVTSAAPLLASDFIL